MKLLPISTTHLSYMYLVIPACYLLVILDVFILNNKLVQFLPTHPEQWAWWIFVFGLPHILFSIFLQADSEYWNTYKKKFLWGALIIIGSVCIIFSSILVLPEHAAGIVFFLFNIFYIAYTMYHVLFQQFGINLSLSGRAPAANYNIWRYTGFMAVSILFTYVALTSLLNISNPDTLINESIFNFIILVILVITCLIFVVSSSIFFKRCTTQSSKRFTLLNILMIGSIVFFFFTPYIVFAFIIPRVIHDTTAFLIYITHNHNKEVSKNILVNSLTHKLLHMWWVLPLIVFIISFVIQSQEHFFFVVIALSLFHYYIEGFVWKKGSPHRKYISFS